MSVSRLNQKVGPIVTILEGKLRGTFGRNLDGDSFLQFFGIPYAKPPVGKLRFKPPLPIDSWNGVKNSTKIGNASISKDDLTKEIVGSEDCLYLNVYTRNLPNVDSKLRPVMVFIHGGSLTSGSSRPGIYGPEFLMIKNIVLVTLNYRLGILGFLAFDDPELGVTGNMGLKDQTLALKWVQRNITYFNGDPNNVTIFGESAGSWSVHAHMLSPISKGLFHKAILQSGVALSSNFWGSKNNAEKVVKHLDKTATTQKEALDILMNCSGLEIYVAQRKLFESPYPAHRRNFAAVIESPNNTAFFTKSPIDILNEETYNSVPTMMGYTETEGMLHDIYLSSAAKAGNKLPEFDLENIIPCEINVAKESSESKEICDILKQVYFDNSDCRHYNEMTDSYFLVGIIETLRHQLRATKIPIYLYRMSLSGNLNFFKRLYNRLDDPGACHADDLGYLFHSDLTPEIKPGSLEDKSIRNFVELWTNFAKYGNPTPDDKLKVLWKPVKNVENIELLDIGNELIFKKIPEQDRVMAWLIILKKYPIVNFGAQGSSQ